ncbi:MAG TPA: GNAT family N-acetyltransferase [Acidimicrobiales bacterium]|nr:GNAT family N-acetyltransferase [Acidimicrobiales bacterium]
MAIREAAPADLGEITAMVLEHAAHEESLHLCRFNEPDAHDALFGPDPVLRALIAAPDDAPEEVAGFALWYPTFSSWASTRGIWLEDLYVKPAFRRLGLGRALLEALRAATSGRVEWDVLDGNEGAHLFYLSLGAAPVSGWTKYRWTLP